MIINKTKEVSLDELWESAPIDELDFTIDRSGRLKTFKLPRRCNLSVIKNGTSRSNW
ncbi:hypothetical protein [Chamaesiphon sp. VAR_69_metabat_338]|uniref:hypothetical protein n=1 Tax=Chamaesiphon sp. VAR_69_metabat_338 TaxID=2964704 RepID=UPI00286DF77C|nr:hypothetical protein [Chamaesiphon sp. VAR_69_metabat_338]